MYNSNKSILIYINSAIFVQSLSYIFYQVYTQNIDILVYLCTIIACTSITLVPLSYFKLPNYWKYVKIYTVFLLTIIPIITGHYSNHPAINFVYSSSVGLISIFIISLISHWTVSLIPWFLMYVNITFVFFEARNQLTQLPSDQYVYYIIYILIYFLTYLLSSIITNNYHKQRRELNHVKSRYKSLLKEKEKLEKDVKEFNSEVDISSKIQRSFYPRSLEINNDVYDMYAYSKSYSKISGDYFDIFKNNDKIYFGIGDVTGHGMSSAIVSVIINRKFKAYVKLGVDNIENILQDLQEDLITVKNKLMTLSIGYIDDNCILHLYGNQEIPVLATTDDCRALVESLDGFILGNSSFNIQNIPYLNLSLNKDEFIILYTDGVTEIESNSGESFGVAGLIEYVKNNKEHFMRLSSKNIVHNILSHIKEWSKNSFRDDTTILIAKRK